MRKIAGLLGILLVLSLLVMPAQVFAGSLAQDCSWEKVKWDDNPDSCRLYLNNWGKTPLTAMSRLAGITLPVTTSACEGNCVTCNDETGNMAACTDPDNCADVTECPAIAECGPVLGQAIGDTCNASAIYGQAHCCCQWGISLAFANKSWSGSDASGSPILGNDHPLFRGNSERRSSAGGGDWGMTGCAHTECKADIWCLPCNADDSSACYGF
jgi:hypothetical protein